MLNAIKSKYILNKIFQNIKNRVKLNIVKYNKNMLDKLYITKGDFKIYEQLKEFNEIFGVNIRDIDIEELDLTTKIDDNDKFEYFNKIDFKNLKNLILKDNDIFDLNLIEISKFVNLEKLDLSNNKISNINTLENLNLKNLKGLNLNDNDISVIKI